MRDNDLIAPALRQYIQSALAKLNRVLPRQGPLARFSYHNPLHGYEDLPFEQALAAAKKLTGNNGYLPAIKCRELYQQGHIADADIYAALHQDRTLQAEEVLSYTYPIITKAAVYRLAMLFDLEPVLPSELAWQIEELNTLEKFQPDIPAVVRQQFLASDGEQLSEKNGIADLWQLLLSKLELQQTYLHPENMLDLSLDQAEALLAQHKASQKKVSLKKSTMHERMREAVTKAFALELQRLGQDMSLRNLMMDLSGVDILDFVRPQIIRLCSSGLDEGLAFWQLPERSAIGIYAAWRAVAGLDINPFLQELPDWQEMIAELPDNPEAAIILQLTHLEIPQAQWEGYLRCLALEMPGWAGMINWREQHPGYCPLNDAKPTLADYLAIRLTLDRLWLNQLCRDTWACEATLSSLQKYFRKNSSEYLVRRHLFRGDLPEYLIQQAETLILSVGKEQHNRSDWQNLADIIWTWQGSAMSNSRPVHSVYDSAWQLFRLSQHLGFSAKHWSVVTKVELEHLLGVLTEFSAARRSYIWLTAYERHYRESLLQMLHSNYMQENRTKPKSQPAAQVIVSMDNRVESLRRFLETGNTAIETFGVAGFLSSPVPNNAGHFSVTDALKTNPLTFDLPQILAKLWHHSLRGNLLFSPLLMVIATPIMLVDLGIKFFAPLTQPIFVQKISNRLSAILEPNTPLVSAESGMALASIAELASLLQTIGLTHNFSPWVVLMGHSSSAVNNSHFAAYALQIANLPQNGSSAVATAAQANRTEVRMQLAEYGIIIPVETWFIAAEYDIGNEGLIWYNLDALPVNVQAAFEPIQRDCQLACQQSVQELPQQLALTSGNTRATVAFWHAINDSQRSPDVAFAGASAVVIGRRIRTQGLCLDKHVFLASYDSTLDMQGGHLEKLLQTIMPALAAINLAYYFATVENQNLGSGNGVLHNPIGQLGVMEGAGSDLRVGLPKQMTGQHAALRLQLVVESTITQLQQLFARQSNLRQLIHNGWVQLSAQDPATGILSVFDADQQFRLWQPDLEILSDSAQIADAHLLSLKVAEHG
ncbi:MAG: DUF2309 family protein [Methylococcaceae bacterium]|nr:DUF2309 family protein [Methylococcaceae bacterium]